jgi:acyl carrier protein
LGNSSESVETTVTAIVVSILGFQPENGEDYVESGDMDSLHIMEVLLQIEEIFDLDLMSHGVGIEGLSSIEATVSTIKALI